MLKQPLKPNSSNLKRNKIVFSNDNILYATSYYAYAAKKSSGPIAPGSKEIPEGSPNCLEVSDFVYISARFVKLL